MCRDTIMCTRSHSHTEYDKVRCLDGIQCITNILSMHRHLLHRALHSFPTRRSSDLGDGQAADVRAAGATRRCRGRGASDLIDRKSTRLNSSHVEISYAVFCLKKKKNSC